MPIWTDLTLPTKGMKATNQEGAIAAVAVGNAMVVDTALANPGTSLRRFGKAQLRSQDMQLALIAVPAGMGRLPKTIVGPRVGIE